MVWIGIISRMHDYQAILHGRDVMELPKYEWRKKDAGMIRDWWKQRIQQLCLNGEYQNADALFREFDLNDE